MGFIQDHIQQALFDALKAKNLDLTDPKAMRLVEGVCKDLPSQLADVLLKTLYERRDSMLADRRWRHRQFVRRNELRWRDGFDFLEMHIEIAMEIGSEFNDDNRPKAAEQPDYVFEVLTRLHARACLIAREIVALLRNGFPDGAHARWRALHELAVTAKFMTKHGQGAAYRYLSHEHVETYKRAINYQDYCETLSREPLPDDELDHLRVQYEQVCAQFGKGFSQPYGWAASFLKNHRPKFSDLEKEVELDFMNPYYKMASSWVHATPRGLSFQLAMTESEEPILLTGSSNSGMVDPAQCTAASLSHVTRALLSHKPTVDHLVMMEVLQTVTHQVSEAFLHGNQVTYIHDSALTRCYRAMRAFILLVKERYASWKWWRQQPKRSSEHS